METMQNKKLLAGAIIVGFVFLLILLMLLLASNRPDTSDIDTANDQNRIPTKSVIINDEQSRRSGNQQDKQTDPDDTDINKYITPGPSPTDSPPELDYSDYVDMTEQIAKSQLQNAPDAFLYNKLPYEQADFSMTAELVKGGGGLIEFTAVAKNPGADIRQSVTQWLTSLGLTLTQIQTLSITFK